MVQHASEQAMLTVLHVYHVWITQSELGSSPYISLNNDSILLLLQIMRVIIIILTATKHNQKFYQQQLYQQ